MQLKGMVFFPTSAISVSVVGGGGSDTLFAKIVHAKRIINQGKQ